MKNYLTALGYLLVFFCGSASGAEQTDTTRPIDRLNVVLLTLDDLGYDSCGVTGCTMPGITPNIDRLAREGVRFEHAFVVTSICGPSRAAMLTGRYPHNNGIMGHGKQPPAGWQPPVVQTPNLVRVLSQHGYFTAAILKCGRFKKCSRVYISEFDLTWFDGPFGTNREDRDPEAFYQRTKQSIENALREEKPFFIYVNPIDPHRPWPGTKMEEVMHKRWNPDDPPPAPSRRFQPEQVFVPPFLPDLPQVRQHIAPYYESVHRGDQCVGRILDALRDTGQLDHTLVIFCSDHGMAVPGAKWSLFGASMRTPLIVRWPGKAQAGTVDREHVVSTVDFMPTILDAIGLPPERGMDGRSLVPLLGGQPPQLWRDAAFLEQNYFHESNAGSFYPIRGLAGRRYLYLWNAYVQLSEKTRPYYGSNHELIKLFETLGKEQPSLAERARHHTFRPAEELYDLENDPGCWTNLADQPAHLEQLDRMRAALLKKMTDTNDPQLELFSQKIMFP